MQEVLYLEAFSLINKKNHWFQLEKKLPGLLKEIEYDLEYGEDYLSVQKSALHG